MLPVGHLSTLACKYLGAEFKLASSFKPLSVSFCDTSRCGYFPVWRKESSTTHSLPLWKNIQTYPWMLYFKETFAREQIQFLLSFIYFCRFGVIHQSPPITKLLQAMKQQLINLIPLDFGTFVTIHWCLPPDCSHPMWCNFFISKSRMTSLCS